MSAPIGHAVARSNVRSNKPRTTPYPAKLALLLVVVRGIHGPDLASVPGLLLLLLILVETASPALAAKVIVVVVCAEALHPRRGTTPRWCPRAGREAVDGLINKGLVRGRRDAAGNGAADHLPHGCVVVAGGPSRCTVQTLAGCASSIVVAAVGRHVVAR